MDDIRKLIDDFRKEHKTDHQAIERKLDVLDSRLIEVEKRVMNGISERQEAQEKRLDRLESQNIELLKDLAVKVDRSESSGSKSRSIATIAAICAGLSALGALGSLTMQML